jgi:hypothetical protein
MKKATLRYYHFFKACARRRREYNAQSTTGDVHDAVKFVLMMNAWGVTVKFVLKASRG